MNILTGASTREIIAVVAAMAVNKKKIAKSPFPKGNCANASGILLNSKLGPELGLIPNSKTTGNIATPAINDITVSDIATLTELPIKFVSFL